MKEKFCYSPYDIAIMSEKTRQLEKALETGDTLEICRKIDEYRQNVPENVRQALYSFFGEDYIEQKATNFVAK